MRTAVLILAAASLLPAADSIQLFNGKDLTGWEMVGPGRFVIEDGMLRTEGGMGLLYYKGQKFGNQTVRIVFKTATPKANSGVFVRLPDPPPDPWYGVHNGYEVQIDGGGDDWHSTGAIYSISKVSKRTQKPDWNTMEIRLDGDATRISLNGELVNDFEQKQEVPERKQWFEPVRGPRPQYGYIGLQNHDERSVVYFKEISVSPANVPGASKDALTPNPIAKGERDRMLSYYHATRKQVLDTIAAASEAQWTFKPAPDKWSIQEVVEHLIRTEDFLFAYVASGLDKSLPAPDSKMPDEKLVAMMKDRTQRAEAPSGIRPTGQFPSREAAAGEFRRRRDKNIGWIRETEKDLRGNYVKLVMGTADIYQGLLMIPAHTERHLAQIAEVQAHANYPKQ